jgi:hypothetical protein
MEMSPNLLKPFLIMEKELLANLVSTIVECQWMDQRRKTSFFNVIWAQKDSPVLGFFPSKPSTKRIRAACSPLNNNPKGVQNLPTDEQHSGWYNLFVLDKISLLTGF